MNRPLTPFVWLATALAAAMFITSGVAQDGPVDPKIEKYVASQMKKFDQNKDGKLQDSEWKGLKNPELIDLDGDKAITQEEFTQRQVDLGSMKKPEADAKAKAAIAARNGGAPPPAADAKEGAKDDGKKTPAAKDDKSTGSSSSPAAPAAPKPPPRSNRKSYKFKTAIDRLPKNLPDWFARNDANADGQISMSEYASSYTREKAREFRKYDRNDDGIITPQEALKAPK